MRTRYVACMGDPVADNPTSTMQNRAFEAAGLDWRYLDFVVPADGLAAAMEAAQTFRLSGMNFTMPHKVAVLPYLDELEPSAAMTSAVNPVRRDGDGRLIGLNTDGIGFVAAAQEAGFDAAGATVVLLGAGGAARAAAVELARAGAKRIRVVNRSHQRAAELADIVRGNTDADADTIEWAGVLTPPPCDLIVNCTPIGMSATGIDDVPVRLDALASPILVADMNTEQDDPLFLRQAREAGHSTFSGLSMLAHGGAACFHAWTGERAPVEVLRAELLRATGSDRAPGSA
ncbi:MAG: shikimate dehydrogenase [Actinomycetota bacterium]